MSYKGSVSRFEKFSKVILVLLTLVLAGFLIALGNKVLGDVDGWVASPDSDRFEDRAALATAEGKLAEVETQCRAFDDTRELYQKSLDKARRQYDAQKQSYDDWLQARATIGSSQEDGEVRTRAKSLDQFRKIQESWQARIEEVDAQAKDVRAARAEARQAIDQLHGQASQRYSEALRRHELHLFLLRLGMVVPVLLLGVFLVARYRRSRLWPMVWSYGIFALYAFFFGLVPYMPSFGGYIRYVVGVVLTMLAAYYVIRQLNRYIQKKRAELEASTEERAAHIQLDVALRAFQSHSCPSCERDFLLTKWYPKSRKTGEVRTQEEAQSHCSFCGLPLFGKCPACGQRNFLHFPHCGACGAALSGAANRLD